MIPPILPEAAASNELVLEPGQDLVLRDATGLERIRLNSKGGLIRLRNSNGDNRVFVDTESGAIHVGGSGEDGDLLLYPHSADAQDFDQATLHLNSDTGSARIGNAQKPGSVRVVGDQDQIELDGNTGSITLNGELSIRTPNGELRAQLNRNGRLIVGGSDKAGSVHIRPPGSVATIRLEATDSTALCRFGGSGTDGRLELSDGEDNTTIVLNGNTGNIGVGAESGGNAGVIFVKGTGGNNAVVINGQSNKVFVKKADGQDTITLNGEAANVGIGGNDVTGDLFVNSAKGVNRIHLSGETGNVNASGDVRLGVNFSDCAEDFPVNPAIAAPSSGDVMVIGEHGDLVLCTGDYANNVAGVVAGAGGLRPGIILGHDPSRSEAIRLSLTGRVYCKVDADRGAVKPGDLLTSSSTPGHAMRVSDLARGSGSIVGKALGSLQQGRGLVQILTCLQ